jgi:hypothetical protein
MHGRPPGRPSFSLRIVVEALDAAPGVTVDSRTDVIVSGYSGTLVEFTTSDSVCG